MAGESKEVRRIQFESLIEFMDELENLMTDPKIDLTKLSVKEQVLLKKEVKSVITRLKSYK